VSHRAVAVTAAWCLLAAAAVAAEPAAERPATTRPPADLAPFEYEPAKVAFYSPPGHDPARRNEPLGRMQKPLAAAESRKRAITPVGFRVELFAAEPLLEGKPLAMCFGPDGEVYVAESVDYPNDLVEPGQGDGRDRIVRLADADGDGRADRRTVFAEPLSIPTSMLAHAGGLIVAQAPQVLFLADTDGDGRADRRDVLFSGWGTGDTHAGPSNLTWGLDGWVYGVVGYSGFRGEVGGERHRFGAGFFRFQPDGSRLEFLRSTNNNSWGFGFSEEGLVFGSTANGNPSEHMPLPNRVYERVRGWSATTLGGIAGSPAMELAPRAGGEGSVSIRQVDHHGRFTAAAGHRLYTARAYPRDYWNRTAFVCEPTGHLVATFDLLPRGAGFSSRMAWNLVASDDEWTAPIQAEVGPDGNVWVIDWYNFIVQHNPTPAGFETGRRGAYVTPLRDKTRGRIWRVVHEQASPPGRASLAGPSPAALVAALRDDNLFWRERAQRRLLDRAAGRPDGGRDAVPALIAMVADPAVDEIGLAPGVIHAIWTLRSLGALTGEAADPAAVAGVQAALAHRSAGVRLNAVRALPRDDATLERLAASGVVVDPSPLVRLAVLDALGEWRPSPAAAAVVTRMLADPATLTDPILADAATSAAAVQAAGVLPTLVAAGSPAQARPVIVERACEHVARSTDSGTVAVLLERLPMAPPAVAAAVVAGLARGWPEGSPASFGAAADEAVERVVASLPPAAQGQLLTFLAHAGSRLLVDRAAAIRAALVVVIDDSTVTDAARVAAAERLVAVDPGADDAVAVIVRRVDGRASPELAAGLLAAAGRSTSAGAADLILDRLPTLTPLARASAVQVVLANRNWASKLVERLERGAVPVGDIPIGERTKLTGHPDAVIRDRAARVLAAGGGLPDADRQRVIDAILPVVLAGGDADRGRRIYKEYCGGCHVHAGEGGRVGPELTGMAVHPAGELLVHILDPNRSVEGNYRAYTVTTGDGRVLTGLLAAESRTAIEIVDAQGKRVAVQRQEIEELAPSPNSLMPVGFEKQISPAGFADLLAFLTSRGKFVGLPLDKVATAVSSSGMFHDPASTVDRLVFSDWGPKQFRGVPFVLVDPQGASTANVVLLHGPQGFLPPRMPARVSLPVSGAVAAIHLLGGVAGWGHPASPRGQTSMIVRLVYADGATEDHPLVNGEHVADYIRRVDVPGSEFAFDLAGRQIRYLRIQPGRTAALRAIDLVKGDGISAPIVMAVTLEMP